MTPHPWRTVGPTLGLLAAAIGGQLGNPVAAAEAIIVVDMTNFEFLPAAVRAAPGDVVTFTNLDDQVHTATSVAPGFDTGDVAPGASGSITAPAKAGEYAFYCVHHAAIGSSGAYEGMVGTLIVVDDAQDGPALVPSAGAAWSAIVSLALAVTLRTTGARPSNRGPPPDPPGARRDRCR